MVLVEGGGVVGTGDEMRVAGAYNGAEFGEAGDAGIPRRWQASATGNVRYQWGSHFGLVVGLAGCRYLAMRLARRVLLRRVVILLRRFRPVSPVPNPKPSRETAE